MIYDVVIIGSGFGGLACAHELSRSGRSVLLLERQGMPGGCLQSFRRGNYTFDTGFHYIGGLAEGQPLHDIFARLGLLQLPWKRLDPAGSERVSIGNETFALAEGFEAYTESLARRFPAEHTNLQRFTSMLANIPSWQEGGEVNAYTYLRNLFSDPLLTDIVAGPALKMELRRESLPLYTLAHTLASNILSSWRLQGPGNLLVDTLVEGIRRQGGQLVCHAEVEELIEQDGRIVMARCADGRCFEGRLFVSDVHPQITFDWVKTSALLRPLFRRRIRALENTGGIFTASLVLRSGALSYFNHNKYIYRHPDIWTPPSPDIIAQGTVDRVMVSCRVPELTDNSTSGYPLQLDLLTPLPWQVCKAWESTRSGHRGPEYELMKQRLANACIELAERAIPGLADMVEKRVTHTPLTYRDFTGTPQGSAYGVRKDSRQMMLTMLSPKTPIPNLFLTGQSLAVHGLEGVAMTAIETTNLIYNIK
ncbi:MAG: NAD(P)/FAD-dependent oxidoreductase [Bacteroidales bacterium]|nr:NAD(P)/FAD-dependent oxidoreductase [Bacteroidales bacterium]